MLPSKSPNISGSKSCRFLFLLTEEYLLSKTYLEPYFLLALGLEADWFFDIQAFISDYNVIAMTVIKIK